MGSRPGRDRRHQQVRWVEALEGRKLMSSGTPVEIDTISPDPTPGVTADYPAASEPLNGTALGDAIKSLESEQEEVRNDRTMDTTAFQNFDQQSNQLYNMLSSVVKTMSEMRSIGAGSRSGL